MEFKFSIGQFVTTLEGKAGSDLIENMRGDDEHKLDVTLKRWAIPLFILERRLQECSGGTQIHYLCRYYASAGYTEHWFNEIELAEHPILGK